MICASMECPCPCIALHLRFFVFPAISAITCQSQEINKSIVLLRRWIRKVR